MSTVGWLGLGAMGSRMARRLLDAGTDLVVWNRTPGRAEMLPGARVAATPAEAIRQAELIVTMLADPAALHAVTDALAAAGPGTTVVEMSTVGPAEVARLRSALPREIDLLDAPVLGSRSEAESGSLTLLVGGPASVVERWTPLLSVLGEVDHVGPVGAGATAKLVANNALLGVTALLGESIALADDLGLPREVTWRTLDRTPLAAQARRRRPSVDTECYPARFPLALASKDAELIVAAADRRLARAIRDWLADARAAGLGADDYTAVLGHILTDRP